MKEILNFMRFVFKEQLQYKWNFLFWILVMIINDLSFFILFLIFFTYFKWMDLNTWDFLLVWSLFTVYFGFSNWLIVNIVKLWEIIETGKLDYYLSFPKNPLKLILLSKIDVFGIWDIFFWFFAMIFYLVYYWEVSLIFIFSWFILVIFWLIFVTWLYLFWWWFSFFLDKWSEVTHIFGVLLWTFWSYPSKLFKHRLVVYFGLWLFWLFPMSFFPYDILKWDWNLFKWFVVIFASIWMCYLGYRFFQIWLRKYASWNLVLQM